MVSLDYKLSFTTLISPSQTRLPFISLQKPVAPYFFFPFILFFFRHFPPPPSPFSPAAVNGDDGGGCRRGFLRPLPLTRKPSLFPLPSSLSSPSESGDGEARRRRLSPFLTATPPPQSSCSLPSPSTSILPPPMSSFSVLLRQGSWRTAAEKVNTRHF